VKVVKLLVIINYF